ILGLLNRALAEDAPEGYFATLLLARLDPEDGSCVYASAGHTAGYLLGSDGAVKAVLPATGMPLAILPDHHFDAAAAPALEPGELLLLLTDGIVEAHDLDSNI